MWAVVAATLCAGLFAGAAIYVNAVEHPARLSCGVDVALREFAPCYRRATVMQASLAIAGCVMGAWSAWLSNRTSSDRGVITGARIPDFNPRQVSAYAPLHASLVALAENLSQRSQTDPWVATRDAASMANRTSGTDCRSSRGWPPRG